MFVLLPSLQESLSEKAQGELLTLSEKLKHFGIHFGSWLLSTGLAVGCGASIYYLCQYEQQVLDNQSFFFFVKIGVIVFAGYRLKRTEETVSSLFGEVTLVVPLESIITNSSLCVHV